MKREAQKYHVVPAPHYRWEVREEGVSRVLSSHPSKEKAQEVALRHALNSRPSQVMIHHRDGSLEARYLFSPEFVPFDAEGELA